MLHIFIIDTLTAKLASNFSVSEQASWSGVSPEGARMCGRQRLKPLQIDFQHVQVALPDLSEGRLVFVDGRLAAVIVRLGDNSGAHAGKWFVEIAFGDFEAVSNELFLTLEALEDILIRQLRTKSPTPHSCN